MLFAQRATCSRNQVGVVIAKEGRILVTGYNGAPAGMPHCNHTCWCTSFAFAEPHDVDETRPHEEQCPLKPCVVAVHGEANAIAWAARNGVPTQGADLFTTVSPCYSCAQLIINAGIIRVVYHQLYRLQKGLNLLVQAGVHTCHEGGAER
jgi:dCMP deaminase